MAAFIHAGNLSWLKSRRRLPLPEEGAETFPNCLVAATRQPIAFARRMRSRFSPPLTAKLMPQNHGLGACRQPLVAVVNWTRHPEKIRNPLDI